MDIVLGEFKIYSNIYALYDPNEYEFLKFHNMKKGIWSCIKKYKKCDNQYRNGKEFYTICSANFINLKENIDYEVQTIHSYGYLSFSPYDNYIDDMFNGTNIKSTFIFDYNTIAICKQSLDFQKYDADIEVKVINNQNEIVSVDIEFTRSKYI